MGSSDPAAVPQEMATAHMPARPFLAPVAAEMGEEVARAVGARVAAALRGDGPDGFDPGGVQLISGSGEHPDDLGDVPPQDRRAVEEGLESPGQPRAHELPQIVPGLNSPDPTIPRFGGGRGSMPAAPRPAAPTGQSPTPAASSGQQPTLSRPGSQAPGAATLTGQPPAQAVPSSPAAPRPAAPSGQAPTPAGQGLPVNATGRLKPAAPIENPAMPADRHYVDRIKMGSPRRPKNTVILRNVDIRPDIQAIRMGRAMRDGPYYVINGRYYEMHQGGAT